MKYRNSSNMYIEATKYIPGGVNSPVRAFGSVGIKPIFIKHASGSKIIDVDDNEYIDYICSWGPLILGHSNEEIYNGVEDIFRSGTTFGVPTYPEVELAKMISEAYEAVDMVRMVNSGTEATMSAIRLARGYTKKNKIIKFEGCYHGHNDSLLVKSGSGTLTFGNPTSLGIPQETIKDTIVCPYNDIDTIEHIFAEIGDDIAGIIVEPIAGNMGVVAPKENYLKRLRKLCDKHKALLIFDEVITGFRVSYGGAASIYGVNPDLACFGKIIGGGLPVGAYGGKREIMENVSPLGDVYQAGTLSGNPLAVHLGLNTLRLLKDSQVYELLEKKAILFEQKCNEVIERLSVPVTVSRVKGMLCLFFTDKKVETYDDVVSCDTDKFSKYFKEMLDRGILLPPSQFEGLFLSTKHTEEDILKTIVAIEESLKNAFSL